MRVIDAHVHWFKDWNFFPAGYLWDSAEAGARSVFPYGDAKEVLEKGRASNDWIVLDPDGKRTLADQAYCGSEVSVIIPLDLGMTRYNPKFPDWQQDAGYPIEEINRLSCELAREHPGRIYSFCAVDPRRPRAVQIFEEAVVKHGAKGLKLFPPCGFYPHDPICYPLYAKAVDLRVPVMFHTGYAYLASFRSDTCHPRHIEPVAMDFPDLTIIIAHSGIQTKASTAWWEEAMGIAWAKWNVHLDITSWNMLISGLTFDIPRLVQMLRTQCDIVGAHRVLLGTDLPGFQLPGDREETKKFITIIRNLVEVGSEHGVVFSQEEVELIAHGNAERLLGI